MSDSASPPLTATSALHPRVAVILGVDKRWHFPLVICRALSTVPAIWWGLRCAVTFLAELLSRGDPGERWNVEKRFRVTEVALAILWCSASAYLSYFFADCIMSRWLLNYHPSATVVRLLTTNALIAYITSWVLYLSGASEDPRLLLPAWISIATYVNYGINNVSCCPMQTLTFLYHISQRSINIRKETTASINVFSIAGFISTCSLLLQLHLTRTNDPEVPLFIWMGKAWRFWKQYRAGTGTG